MAKAEKTRDMKDYEIVAANPYAKPKLDKFWTDLTTDEKSLVMQEIAERMNMVKKK